MFFVAFFNEISQNRNDLSAQFPSLYLASYPWHYHHLIELFVFEWEGTNILRKIGNFLSFFNHFGCLENCPDWSIERSWNSLKGLSCTNRREINVGARGSSPRTQSLCQTHIYFSLFWKRAPIKRWWVFSMVHEIGWMYWKCLGVNDICTVNLLHPMAFLLNALLEHTIILSKKIHRDERSVRPFKGYLRENGVNCRPPPIN